MSSEDEAPVLPEHHCADWPPHVEAAVSSGAGAENVHPVPGDVDEVELLGTIVPDWAFAQFGLHTERQIRPMFLPSLGHPRKYRC